MATTNYASKYASRIDERFDLASQAQLVTSREFEFKGVRTVNVYSIPTVAMNDYKRTGADRYGTPADLGNSVQELTVTRDRAFTFVIDRGDKNQTQMTMDAGKALDRQLKLVCVPEYDSYVFKKLATAACANTDKAGAKHSDATAPTKDNAYELFLHAQEVLGNAAVPDAGRVCLCSYKFANLLKQDPSFMKYGDLSQTMALKGVMGEVDGTRIVKVPASRLPKSCSFILTHPMACCAPKQLESYKVHTDPPGISGWLVEGRIVYDAFVLKNKADAIFYQGAEPVV